MKILNMITEMQTNRLEAESSLYLKQHSVNPVNWYPWSNDAFVKARTENKIIIISIGYSSCHWCHVMEKEAFSDIDIASFMNDNFVCIKVDREERPDIDQLYMMAANLSSGQGGWPLNCFALPDGKPFYGATYFKPDQWKEILLSINNSWKSNPESLLRTAQKIEEGIIFNILPQQNQNLGMNFTINDITSIVENIKRKADNVYGGFGNAPKFPMPVIFEFLIQYNKYFKDNNIEKHIYLSLDNIANGGIYDHVSGGFARYSTDKKWRVPHFEKMLYDNAQLISLFSHAFQIENKPYYRHLVYETLCFIRTELTSSLGGFFSSIDADSDGIEGQFYMWKKTELDEILGFNSNLFCEYYSVHENGNFSLQEAKQNILYVSENVNQIASKYRISQEHLNKTILQCKRLLIEERDKRIKPVTDKKIITSWNAMMVKAYTDAYKAFSEPLFIEWAIAGAEFIEENLKRKEGRLKHIFNDFEDKTDFLEDYAFTADAFISLYQCTFDEKWLHYSKQFTDYAINEFYESQLNLFYSTSGRSDKLFTRNIEITDNVISSSNSTIAKVLLRLSKYFRNEKYKDISAEMLKRVKNRIIEDGLFHTNWASLALEMNFSFYEVIMDSNSVFKNKLLTSYFPNIIIAGCDPKANIPLLAEKELCDADRIFVCKENVCLEPFNDILKVIEFLENSYKL